MYIAVLTKEQAESLEAAILLSNTQWIPFGLAFDPLDNSLKWKLDSGPWSPPVRTENQ